MPISSSPVWNSGKIIRPVSKYSKIMRYQNCVFFDCARSSPRYGANFRQPLFTVIFFLLAVKQTPLKYVFC